MKPNLWNPDTYLRAWVFAAGAHGGQKVPGSDHPYLTHLGSVCMEVCAAFRGEPGCDEDLAVQCAILHDVVEDTPTPLEDVRLEFGEAVAAGVSALSKNPALPKKAQLGDSLERIRKQPREVWRVKLGDRITNLQPPPSHWTKEKIAHYRDEAATILQALGEASPFMADRLKKKINEYKG